ncbi:MAG TPA: choice-of-anchor tandem repeat GloVer-containing protein [Rhizomicrobium sp.]|nr:choice-of-anchor tandem repeat GloVer-containing protein [Rhizomicrobium sp.]
MLYSFCSLEHPECLDGEYPTAGLINVKGLLYGTTMSGGPHGYGEVFSLDLDTNLQAIVYPFCSQSQKKHGRLCTDGANPQAGVIDVDGTLYGTTYIGGGGKTLSGTVFAVNTKTGDETLLYSFSDKDRDYKYGGLPDAGVINLNGALYGTTPDGGGRHGDGSVFSLDLKKDVETVLYAFSARKKRGIFPEAGLIDVNGMLYGTTSEGGKYNNGGTVFSIDPTTGIETVLHSFKGTPSDGAGPFASLTDVNGTLYGTTEYGGAYGYGTVFSLEPTSGAVTVLYSFQGYPSDAGQPVAGVIEVNGMLYGTTEYGGSYDDSGDCSSHGIVLGCGTVFSLDPNSGAETILYSFCAQQFCADGAYPRAAPLSVNGTLYGTTEYGGTYGGGTVFPLSPERELYAGLVTPGASEVLQTGLWSQVLRLTRLPGMTMSGGFRTQPSRGTTASARLRH